jgi:Fe-S cluster biogenesis protein NfuA
MSDETPVVDVYAEMTPNPNTIKFYLNRHFLEAGSLDFPSKEKAETSALPKLLFEVDSVTGVLVGKDFVSVSKKPESDWEPIVTSVIEKIKSFVVSGQPAVDETLIRSDHPGDADEVERKIRQILDDEIRPAVARDGGDIIFYGYQDGIVTLHLQGACSTCPSSIMTLKMGVEGRLKQAIPEIKEVVQV